MDKIKNDFTYFRSIVTDSEIDSSPLPDFEAKGSGEAEYTRAISRSVFSAAAAFCAERELDLLELSQAVFLILLEKYTNNTAALCAVSAEGSPVPVFMSSEKVPLFSEYIAAFRTQVKENKTHMSAGFPELCREFGWNSVPFVTGEAQFYHSFSLSDYQEIEAKLCLFFSFENHCLTIRVKYADSAYGPETMDRIFLSIEELMREILSGKYEI